MSTDACFYYKILSRNDSGNYTCIAEYEGQIVTKVITLSVSYIPSVTFEFQNYTEIDQYRYLQCNANGYPRNYTYKQWEHKSFFDEHIRFLSGNATGYLRLPTQTKQFRYQDNGVYVCSVSNGVPDNSGQLFQKSRAYLTSKENINQTISTEARIVDEIRNIALVSDEHHCEVLHNDSYSSTGSSDHDSNHSGHFDDGYESHTQHLLQILVRTTNMCISLQNRAL
ncbi:DSCAML1 [Mytilus coruscus]|uniref:DSCAML1 n=1 Tax=Mytilus coruscus TaxID=42192 RepID=A0A6J8AKF2_MYTCO|nr:DSCAML1 [Mytilus coruscus]